MPKNNTILKFFGMMVIVLIGASWAFLHSRSFGRLLSKAITEVSSKQFNAKVRFNSVSVRFFPPGVALEGVRFHYTKDGTTIESQAGELGVAFNYNVLRGKKTRIHEIFLREGWAKIVIPKSEKSGEHPWDQIQNELEKLPVVIDAVVIEDSRIEGMGVEVDISNLEVIVGTKEIKINGEIKDLTGDGIPQRLDLASMEAVLKRDVLELEKLTILQKRSRIMGTANLAQWHDVDKMALSANVKSEIYIADIKELIDLDPVEFYNGFLFADGEASWSKAKGPQATMNLKLKDFESNVLHAKQIVGKVRTQGDTLIAEKFVMTNNEEYAEILQSAAIWDQSKKQLFPEGLKLRMRKLDLQNVLSFLRDSLEPLQGLMTGDMNFSMNGLRKLHFVPHNGAKMENFGISTIKDDGSIFHVVRAPIIWLHNTDLRVDNGVVSLKGHLKAPHTEVDVAGKVGNGQVHFDVGPGPINLTDFGNLAELDLKGSGVNTIKVRGPLDHVTMQVDGDFKSFELLEYRLGDTKHQFIIDLGEKAVEIPIFNAKKSRYNYGGTGVVQWGKFLMDLSIQLPQISFTEFKDAIHPLRDGLSFLPADFEGLLQGNVELLAKDNIKSLVVAADVYAQKIVAYGEAFRDAKFAFLFKNQVIRLDGFSMTKESGKASGSISYSLPLSRVDYNLSLRNLSSGEISYYKRMPFAMDFRAAGEFQGWRTAREWRHRGYLGLSGTHVVDKDLPDSHFEWDWRHNSLQFDGKFAQDWIVLNAQSLPQSKGGRVDAKLEVDIPDLPLVLMATLGENPQLVNAEGTLKLESTVSVANWEWHKADIKTWIKEVNLRTPEINLSSKFTAPQVAIERGQVNRWDWRIDSPDLKLSSKAQGDLRHKLVLSNFFDLDAKYLEVFSSHIQRAEGRVSAEVKATLSQNDLDLQVKSSASNISVSTDLLPFTLSQLQYDVSYANNELEVNNLSFRPDSGIIRANGSAFFKGVDPEVNLRWFMEGATIPIKSRSHVTLTGNGMVFGNKRPYILSGDVIINKGSILNEINEFTSEADSTVDTKYLPKEYGGAAAGLMKFDLSVRTDSMINVNNSMLDVFLAGDMHLLGDVFRPTADGRVYVANVNSKAFFKNSEYQITKGEFLFSNRRPITRPDFDVVATSTISNYKVIAKAYGNPENFTFDLNSEPALSKQNVLSLIAFGYTDDLSKTISAEDRQNLTNVGVGSFIFDQFKVTDIVKKQFGLQLNMGTVFEQSNTSMLSNRSGDQGTGALARTRTATNIEIKKRLSEAMSLSVSSTVGGQIGQRQRMNLSYGVSRGVQLEGIYELRTNADGQEDVIDNSIGGDVKFRMTFR